MKAKKFMEKMPKFFLQILLSMMSLIVTIILFLTILLYNDFQNFALNTIHSYLKDTLSQVSYSADYMNDSAKSIALQVYFDPDTQNLIYNYPDFIEKTSLPMLRLSYYKSTTPFVYSIYIYDGDRDIYFTNNDSYMIYKKEDFNDNGIVDIMNNYKNYEILKPIIRRIKDVNSPKDANIYIDLYTYIFYETINSAGKPQKAVIVNVKQEWVDGIISKLNGADNNDTFVIDNNGIQITTSHQHKPLTNLSGEKYISKILSLKEPSGYFIEDINGAKSVVTYVSSDVLGWKFVRITPYSDISAKLERTKYTVVLFVLLMLIIGLVMAITITRILYRPIDKMTNKLSRLENMNRSNFFAIKQEFLNKLLESKHLYSPVELMRQFKNFQIKLRPDCNFFIILLKIDHWKEFCNKFNYKDRSLVKYGIMNIASEFASKCLVCEPVDTGDDSIVLMCNIPPETKILTDGEVNTIINNIFEAVRKHLEVSLTAIITPFTDSLLNLSLIYEEAVEASHYRLIYGHNSIIYTNSINTLNDDDYIYPVNKERQLIEALMLERKEDAKRLYYEIVEMEKGFSYTLIKMTLLRLAIAVGMALNNLNHNLYYSAPCNINILSRAINDGETLEEIDAVFCELFDSAFVKKSDKKSKKYDELLNKVFRIISENYADNNLSLNSLANSVNMSPVYFGRLIKRLTGKSISDHINEIRIEKAKELLTDTDLTINEIVTRIGFTNSSYFYTVFKKYQGMAPNDYRQKQVNSFT